MRSSCCGREQFSQGPVRQAKSCRQTQVRDKRQRTGLDQLGSGRKHTGTQNKEIRELIKGLFTKVWAGCRETAAD